MTCASGYSRPNRSTESSVEALSTTMTSISQKACARRAIRQAGRCAAPFQFGTTTETRGGMAIGGNRRKSGNALQVPCLPSVPRFPGVPEKLLQRRLPRSQRDAQRGGSGVGESGERRRAGRARVIGERDRLDRHVAAPAQLQYLFSVVVPRAVACVGQMVDAEAPGAEESDDAVGEVVHESGVRDLVGDDAQATALVGELLDTMREVAPAGGGQPRRADEVELRREVRGEPLAR